MLVTTAALTLGAVQGVRHAFEPDHLSAISTLVVDAPGSRQGAIVGAWWGVGHTAALFAVGAVVALSGRVIPAELVAGFELVVAIMLLALGVRAVRAGLTPARGSARHHHHGAHHHSHALAGRHLHLGRRAVALRPLAIGVVHGLAGSGSLTIAAVAVVPGATMQLVYIALFGLGSVVGMAGVSALAAGSIGRATAGSRAGAAPRSGAVGARSWLRALPLVAGLLSIAVGVAWMVPIVTTAW